MKYLVLAIIGAILTPIAHNAATAQRGYGAIGGEFLIVPLLMIMLLAIDEAKEAIVDMKEIFSEEEEEEWTEEKTSSTTRC